MILFILLLVVVFWSSYNEGKRLHAQHQKSQDPKAAVISEDVPKFCPPHKWFHQEVKDLEGKTVKWRMVCELCGPLKPQTGPARAE